MPTSRCNAIWETTQQTQRTFACANLLRICYVETGVLDFGLKRLLKLTLLTYISGLVTINFILIVNFFKN